MAFTLTLADKGRSESLVIDGKWHHKSFELPDGTMKSRFALPHADSEIVLSELGAVTWTVESEAADKAHRPQPEAPMFYRCQRYRLVSAGPSPSKEWVKEGSFYVNSTEDVGPIFLRARGPLRVVWAYVYRAFLTTFDEELYGIDYKIETSATPGEPAPPVTLVNRVLKGGETA